MSMVGRQVTSRTVHALVEMIRRDPEKNLPRLLDWAHKLRVQEVYDERTWQTIERAVCDPNNCLRQLG